MKIRPLMIKVSGRLKKLLHKFKKPVTELPDSEFYSTRWQGKPPDCNYFTNRINPCFFFGPQDVFDYTGILKDKFPDQTDSMVNRASEILENRFTVLGFDPVKHDGQVDWHTDFISGKKWPKLYFHKIKIVDYNDKSDIKIPWELSRFQFSPDLAKAFLITGLDEFADKFVELVESWQHENPVDIGVNWVYSMEISIRAINIIWGVYMLSDTGELAAGFIQKVIKNLYYHGLHIEKNLETIADGINTNHLVSNYLGLLYIGLLFPEYDRAQKWQQLAIEGLEREIQSQVLEDGADYENSTSYHRLVGEMFLSAFLLAQKNNLLFSSNYQARLRKMIEFSSTLTAPSGTVPLIGDNDDGFIVKLDHSQPDDHSTLIDIGSVVFNLPISDVIKHTEDKLWYLGPESLSASRIYIKPKSKLLKSSGYAAIKNDNFQLSFNAAEIYGDCLGGHKHNDLLSVSLEIDSHPVFLDAGTACYTSDPKLRNLSRSTAMHNTVIIDNREQCRFAEKALFYLSKDAQATIDFFSDTGDEVIVRGKHTGYSRLSDSPVHTRTVEVSFNRREVVITDEITGSLINKHNIKIHFLTPLDCLKCSDTQELIIGDRRKFLFGIESDTEIQSGLSVKPAYYFPRYGKKMPANLICFESESRLPLTIKSVLTFSHIHKGYNDLIEQYPAISAEPL